LPGRGGGFGGCEMLTMEIGFGGGEEKKIIQKAVIISKGIDYSMI